MTSGVRGAVLVSVLFDVFLSDLTGCSLNRHLTLNWEGCIILQKIKIRMHKDLSRLEGWAKTNKMSFTGGGGDIVLHLDRGNEMHNYKMADSWLYMWERSRGLSRLQDKHERQLDAAANKGCVIFSGINRILVSTWRKVMVHFYSSSPASMED